MSRLSLLVLSLAASTAAAQMPAAGAGADRAAATITEADVARRVHVIAHDSMMGRATPSRGLELTAQYVADEFRRFGLKPGGERGTFFQRYDIVRWKIETAESHIGFMAGGGHHHAEFAADVRWDSRDMPGAETGGTALLLGGPADSIRVAPEDVRGRAVLVVLDRSATSLPDAANRLLARLAEAGPAGIAIVSNRDSARFALEVARQGNPRQSLQAPGMTGLARVEVHERAIREVLRQAGVDLAAVRGSATAVQRALPGLRVMFDAKAAVLQRDSAPNTIGILEGSDPALRGEYVVYSAHMDHIGIRPGSPDSIANGADDDASGTVGVVELAEAFSRLPTRPRRSILFITVSGEERGLWGSGWFADHPTVPLEGMVANINMDMIGRNWKDTIVAIGREHSDLGATLARVNAAHPELGMTAIDDRWPQERFYFRSDHYNFARKGVPVLFFFNGVHEDYHRVSDSPDKIDAEKEARILKLLFYLGLEVANAADRPRWNPESYRQIVQGAR